MASRSNRDYRREYAIESPERRSNRVKRNQARQEFIKEGKVHVGDGTAIDHKVPLSKGGSTTLSNLRVRSFKANSSYHRTKTGAMKYKDQK